MKKTRKNRYLLAALVLRARLGNMDVHDRVDRFRVFGNSPDRRVAAGVFGMDRHIDLDSSVRIAVVTLERFLHLA